MSALEYQCRQCKQIFSPSEFAQNPLCPNCKTFLLAHSPRKYWLFQFNPAIYNWFAYVSENAKTEQWLATHHTKEICRDDAVAVWSSGKTAGIYAIAQVTSYATKKPLSPIQSKFYSSSDDLNKFNKKPSVIIEYKNGILKNPILLEECRKDDILSTMSVFDNPQATNFRLSREQWNRIMEKINKPEKPTYDTLLSA